MAEGLAHDWEKAVGQLRYALEGHRTREFYSSDKSEIWHLQPSHAYSPLDGWTVSKMEPYGEEGVERLRVFAVSEFPGEMEAFTFFPDTSGIAFNKKREQETVQKNADSADMQMDFGMSEPTMVDYQEFFGLADEIMNMSI